MEFQIKQLDNGLTVIGEVNGSAKSAAVGFFVRTGSRDESEQINGVSHFLEHMLFKGTEKLDALAVNRAFDGAGARYNAFTSEENTVFYAAVLPRYLREVTGLWVELMRPALRETDFEMEKNVIKEEIAMYKDLPSFDVVDRCRSLHFEGHPCASSVLGTEQSITALTAEQMRQYFSRRYVPNNMVVAFAGNFCWEEICSQVEKHCGKWQPAPAERELRPCSGSRKKQRVEKAGLAHEHICLMSQCVSAQDERRYAGFLLAAIIGDDTGSRFYWELVDKALAESATMQFAAMDGTGMLCSYINCAADKAETVLDIVRRIFADVTDKGVGEQELVRAKNKILSSLVIKNEVPMGRLVDLGLNWTYLGCYRSVQQEIDAVKAVTVDDVHRLAAEYPPAGFTQFSIAPAARG